jgi:hypothetical protein
LSEETEEVRDFCEATFTDEIKTAYQEYIDDNLVL